MSTKIWTGSAGAVGQLQTWAPGPQPQNTTASIECNGKTISYQSTSGTNDDLVAGLVAAVKASTIPEFQEVSLVAGAYLPAVPTPNATYLQIGCVTAGKPITVSISLSIPPKITISRTIQGGAGVNDRQKITIGPNAMNHSTFTLTDGANTTAAINLPPAAPTAAAGAAGALTGDYQWKLTAASANVETEAGLASASLTLASQQATITLPTYPADGFGFNLYRTLAGGSTFYYVANIPSGATYTDNATDASISSNAEPPTTNGDMQNKLEALASIGQGNIKVGGANTAAYSGMTMPSSPIVYDVEFIGSLGGASHALLTGDISGVSILPTITIDATQAGCPIQSEIQRLGWVQSYGANKPTGSFTITIVELGVTTAQISFDASAADLLLAIQRACPPAYSASFSVAAVQLTAAGYLWDVTYQGLLANRDIKQATVDVSNMTPDDGDAVSAYMETTQQGSATGKNQIFTVTLNNTPSGGTFGLSATLADGAILSATGIAYNASGATVAAAFSNHAIAGSGAAGGPFTLECVGVAAGQAVALTATSSLTTSSPPTGSPPASNTSGITSPTISSHGQIAFGASADATYYYKVTAVNAVGETTGSAEVSETTTLSNGVIVKWNAVSGATGYKVYRGTAAGSENVMLAQVSQTAYYDFFGSNTAGSVPGSNTAGVSVPTGITTSTQQLFSDFETTLTIGTTYYYKVTATTASGETTGSSEVSNSIADNRHCINIGWNQVTGATGYKIYRGTAAGSENTLIATITDITGWGSGSAVFRDTGPTCSVASPPGSNTTGLAAPVQNNTVPSGSGGTLATATYYYEITAYDDTGETTASNEKSAAVTGPTGSVGLSWGAVTGANGYKVYRGASSGGEDLLIATITGGATTSYTDTGSSPAASLTIAREAVGQAQVDEVQTITVSGATGGTMTLAFEGQGTGAIPYNETAANVQTDLTGLSTVGAGNMTVAGAAGGPYTVTAAGTLAGKALPLLSASSLNLTGLTATPQTLTDVQSATGPNFWSDDQNWSPVGVPVTGDDVWFQFNKVPCLYGLDQSAVALNSLHVDMSFTASIGLPAYTGKYFEYRQRHLKVGVTNSVIIGTGNGGGPSLVNLDFLTTAFSLVVLNTGNPTDSSTPAVNIKGNRAAGQSTLDVRKGRVGVAVAAGETCTVDTIRQSYVDNQSSDAYIFAGEGATITDWKKDGGDGVLNGSLATLSIKGGSLTWNDPAASAAGATSVDIQAGKLLHNATGGVTTLKVGATGTYDRSQSMRTVALGTVTLIKGATFKDPHGVTTWAGGLTLQECSFKDVTLDLGSNIELPSRTQL